MVYNIIHYYHFVDKINTTFTVATKDRKSVISITLD